MCYSHASSSVLYANKLIASAQCVWSLYSTFPRPYLDSARLQYSFTRTEIHHDEKTEPVIRIYSVFFSFRVGCTRESISGSPNISSGARARAEAVRATRVLHFQQTAIRGRAT